MFVSKVCKTLETKQFFADSVGAVEEIRALLHSYFAAVDDIDSLCQVDRVVSLYCLAEDFSSLQVGDVYGGRLWSY